MKKSKNCFTLSGVWKDSADFAVLVLYDADDPFGHPRWRYLPDFDFSGLTLKFDAAYTNLASPGTPFNVSFTNADLLQGITGPHSDRCNLICRRMSC